MGARGQGWEGVVKEDGRAVAGAGWPGPPGLFRPMHNSNNNNFIITTRTTNVLRGARGPIWPLSFPNDERKKRIDRTMTTSRREGAKERNDNNSNSSRRVHKQGTNNQEMKGRFVLSIHPAMLCSFRLLIFVHTSHTPGGRSSLSCRRSACGRLFSVLLNIKKTFLWY